MTLDGYTSLVYDNTTHSDTETIGIRQNWIQWALSKVYKPLEVERLATHIAQSKEGLCSERSFLLVKILERNEIPARMIGLNGHVVVEAYNGLKWVILDPDYGIVTDKSLTEMESNTEKNEYIDLYTSKDNFTAPLYNSLSHNYYTLCLYLDALKLLCPIIFIYYLILGWK